MSRRWSLLVKVNSLVEFRNLPSNTNLNTIEIPEKPENRKSTNSEWLYFFIFNLVVLFPFLIYCVILGDLGRLFGYDQCGNVCGRKNVKYDGWPCTGQDFTDLPYLQVDATPNISGSAFLLSPRRCVARCGPDYIRISSTCYKLSNESQNSFEDEQSLINDGFLDSSNKRDSRQYDIHEWYDYRDENEKVQQGLSEYLEENAWRIGLACFVSLTVGIIMLVLFKIATAIVVWSFIVGVFLTGAVMNFLILFVFSSMHAVGHFGLFISFIGIFLSLVWLILLCMVIAMFRKIQLVIQLFQEAAKATYAMPRLLFIPFYFFIFDLMVTAMLTFTSLCIISAGLLGELEPGYYYYKNNGIITITFLLNFIVALWSSQILVGLQCMVIGGAVAKWYWTKDKKNLGRPISTSARVAIKFHLGSIAAGSLVIMMLNMIKPMICRSDSHRSRMFRDDSVSDACIDIIDRIVRFLTSNSYILTAMHGQPFYKSGKRAARILYQNFLNIVSIDYVGDFVLVMAQFLIVLISMLLTVGIMQGAESDHEWSIYLIVFFASSFIASFSFATFKTAIDTLFMCFCEDSLLNDGVNRPYAMSRDLMEFVEKSKKVYKKKNSIEEYED